MKIKTKMDLVRFVTEELTTKTLVFRAFWISGL